MSNEDELKKQVFDFLKDAASIDDEEPTLRESPPSPKQQVRDLIKANQRTQDRLQRLAADYDNYKKRVERDKEEMGEEKLRELVLALLPVIDDLDRCIKMMHPSLNSQHRLHRTGIQMMRESFLKVLGQFGVEVIPSPGREFDPTMHEAVACSGEGPNTIITEEHSRGYLMRGKVIRAAKVTVAKCE